MIYRGISRESTEITHHNKHQSINRLLIYGNWMTGEGWGITDGLYKKLNRNTHTYIYTHTDIHSHPHTCTHSMYVRECVYMSVCISISFFYISRLLFPNPSPVIHFP